MSAKASTDEMSRDGLSTTSPIAPPRTNSSPFQIGALSLGRIAGIDVRLHYTWPLFAFVTIGLTVGSLPGTLPELNPIGYSLLGSTLVLLLFVSVLVHELSHSFVAKARGLQVSGITLFVFGGMSNIEGETEHPDDELMVYMVGPLISLALAGLFWGVSLFIDSSSRILMAMPYLAMINLVLALVNLVPGIPLDGGRVLRAIIWKVTGSALKGTRWASWLGQVFAFIVVALGAILLLDGNYLGAIWNAFIGWFLNGVARGARELAIEPAGPNKGLDHTQLAMNE